MLIGWFAHFLAFQWDMFVKQGAQGVLI